MIQHTTKGTRFLVAKHVPDLKRMEPRNIGVIVWSDGAVHAKFAGENGSLPSHVKSRSSYREWIDYWRTQLSQSSLRRKDGSRVDNNDPEFVDQLRMQSKTQYILADGGVMLELVDESNIAEVTDDLYQELVATSRKSDEQEKHREAGRQLYNHSQKALKSSGLFDRKDFWSGFDWACPVDGIAQPFHFDYAIHTSTEPQALLHRVSLQKLNNVYSTAFQFQHMKAAYSELRRENCGVLVYATEADLQDDDFQQAWGMMNATGTVIDVSDPDKAAAHLLALVG